MVAAPAGVGARVGFDRSGLLWLLVVYLGWSSTYLFIRIAVREGSGFPPFTMAGTRLLAAGLLLFVIALAMRSLIRPRRQDLVVLAVCGVLLWLGGNGLVTWAEQRAESSYAALLVGSSPIWVALLESLVDRRPPTVLLTGSLLLGFAGLGVLAAPRIAAGAPADSLSVLALLGGSLSWSVGALLQTRRPVRLSPVASAAHQHLYGGGAVLLVALAVTEPPPTPTTEAWGAWLFLVLFGSVVTFTAYVQALRKLPIGVVSTHAYVNPLGATLLGWLILREEITLVTFAGAALILLGVGGVFHARRASPSTI